MSDNKKPEHGKKPNQKLKPYLVMQYLMRKTDENNLKTAYQIAADLRVRGIYAERRSIYHDIQEINKAMLLADNEDMTVEEAEEILEDDIDDIEKTVVYDKSRKGFYVRQRHYQFDDIRLLNECIYSAKFLTEAQTKRLSNVVCEFVSEEQAKDIQHDVFLPDRVKTINKSVINNISIILEAIASKETDSRKITFKYLKYSINDINHQVERRKGDTYKASPYVLLLNDGYYYAVSYDDHSHRIIHYRVDRMRDVRITQEPREGQEKFAALDMKNFIKRTFGMFDGPEQRITICFENSLLDTAIDRFGTSDAQYIKYDEKHFTVNTIVKISPQFYGWICGFGSAAKIISPPNVVEKFKVYLDKIRSKY